MKQKSKIVPALYGGKKVINYKFNIFNGKLKLNNTENYFNSAISLPIFFDLSKEKQMYVIKSVYQFFKKKIKL